MSVTAFQDLPMADRDREWDGAGWWRSLAA